MQMSEKSVVCAVRAVFPPLLLVLFCASCASAPPKREDGIVGLIYDTVSKRNRGKDERVEKQSPPASNPASDTRDSRSQAATSEEKGQVRYPSTDYEYGLQPGDIIAVSFFSGPSYSAKGGEEYRIGKLDTLKINIEGPEPLTAAVTVRMDGMISFTLVGDIPVEGKTIQEIRDIIQDKLASTVAAAGTTVYLEKGQGLAGAFLDSVAKSRNEPWARVVVRPDGIIGLPAIGDLNVVGMSPARVTQTAQAEYDALFNGGVSVHLNLIPDRANTPVLGEVLRPGLYPLYQSIHPLAALAMAGGETEDSNLKKVVLLKIRQDGSYDRHLLNLSAGSVSKHLARTDVLVEPRDILLVPKTGIANVNKWIDQHIRRVLPLPVYGNVSHPL